ncbi:hypothetical protein ASG60_03610 [Methylobacterium sp. Leaf469]|nr:hypothetical protein ASG60_03610 [Methylobacterium sp. Leaf469]
MAVGDGAGRRAAPQGFELGERRLDRIEVRVAGGKGADPCAGRLAGLTHADHLVDVQVVEDDGIARLQHRNQRVGR